MSEKKPKIVRDSLKTIRVEPTLHKEIKAETVERDENIEETVERAWRAYKALSARDDGPHTQGHSTSTREVIDVPGVHSNHPLDNVTPQAEPWVYKGRKLSAEDVRQVEMFLEIIWSEKPGTPDWIKGNIKEFHESLEAWRERTGLGLPAPPRSDSARALGGARKERDASNRDRAESEGRGEEIDRKMDEVQELGKPVEDRKKRDPGKSGSGGSS